ncbi:hypothetical protein ACIA8K_35445 [Catenuloplanes sp. NPDC051500]
MDETRLIGARDPHGFRPLFLGRLDTGGWVLALASVIGTLTYILANR